MQSEPTGNRVPFPDEIARLSEIERRLDAALRDAAADVDRIDREYRDAKRGMAEARGELDPTELFQTELLLKQTDRTGAFAVGFRDKLAKLKDSPYFARIDFQETDEDEPEPFYIGRFAFSHENELLIFDWRAPVAGMFYDCAVGPAGYEAPIGRIDGTLTRKRQFKIKNGVMEYALESAAHVQDEILQQELSHTSDEKMKSIIATIQKEQNQIIRNEKADTLIIQGVAGSGKTSIALHRVAFLLYRFRDRLHARNVTILSPNRVFGDYIANVIPELGEEPIYALSLSDLAEAALMQGVRFEPDRDPLEVQDESWASRARFKSTMDFVAQMDSYIERLPARIFSPADCRFDGAVADGAWIGARFRAYGKHPILRRLSMIAEDIRRLFETDFPFARDVLPETRTILKRLTAMLSIQRAPALYRDFYKSIGMPHMLVLPQKNTLEWADVFPFLYLQAAFEGIQESRVTKHLVIDEMQDYTPIQFAVLNRMFPCQKTILGDFGQILHPNHAHTLADIRGLYKGAAFVALHKSYRSTLEIMTFAGRIQKNDALDAVARHGEKPAVLPCASAQAEIDEIKARIRRFQAGSYASLGIVLKTDQAARALYRQLCDTVPITLITPESTRFESGISVTSIRMAKGLEFDEVIVPQADSRTYGADYDRALLYIACTRAMHRLTLLYTGALPVLRTICTVTK